MNPAPRVFLRHKNAPKIREMRERGATLQEIGDLFGVSRQAIDQVLNPLKAAARERIQRQISSGKITRPETCSRCGQTGKIESHHHDYGNPLRVDWLCRPCHARHIRKTSHATPKKITPKQIKKARQKLGMTQEDFARAVGVRATSVHRWEVGKHKPLSIFERIILELVKQKRAAA